MSNEQGLSPGSHSSLLITHCSLLMGVEPGLCGTCHMSRRIVTARGSTFYYCTRAEADPAYVKYPRLPVLACPGYRRDEASGAVGRGEEEGKSPGGKGAPHSGETGPPE